MFEAKRKGYCFIPYRFTVKVKAKSKSEGRSGSIVLNRNVLGDRQHMPRVCLPHRWPQSSSLANLQLPARNLPFLPYLNRRTEVVRSHFLIYTYAGYKRQPNRNCFHRHAGKTTKLRVSSVDLPDANVRELRH